MRASTAAMTVFALCAGGCHATRTYSVQNEGSDTARVVGADGGVTVAISPGAGGGLTIGADEAMIVSGEAVRITPE